jgi:hypothetical protein
MMDEHDNRLNRFQAFSKNCIFASTLMSCCCLKQGRGSIERTLNDQYWNIAFLPSLEPARVPEVLYNSQASR